MPCELDDQAIALALLPPCIERDPQPYLLARARALVHRIEDPPHAQELLRPDLARDAQPHIAEAEGLELGESRRIAVIDPQIAADIQVPTPWPGRACPFLPSPHPSRRP